MGNWESNVRKVSPYTPGEQPRQKNIIKLNTNENPYPPSPAVMKAWKETDWDLLRRYPDPFGRPLLSAVAEYYHLNEEEVFLGVGSDEVLALSFLTFFNGDKPVLFPDITYSFYDVWAELYRIPYVQKALDENFCIRKEDYLEENGGIILANPNAPTGVDLPAKEVEEILRKNPDSVVIVDEAYVDFGAESVLPLIRNYENLLVIQTFSKSRALAGMRIGCAFGNAKLIKYLYDVKFSFNSYTMNQPAIILGEAALRDTDWFKETVQKICTTRERVYQELCDLGFTVLKSRTNFLLVTHGKIDCIKLFQDLRNEGIYVRHFNKPKRILPWLRVTIGTEEEMDCFLDYLKKYPGLAK